MSETNGYLTRAAVAGNRLSDLIEALKLFDPDTKISVQYVEREDHQIRLVGVETRDGDGDGDGDGDILDPGWVPDSEALL